jgi:DNA repair exonuclease SbcCD ATPase subunit
LNASYLKNINQFERGFDLNSEADEFSGSDQKVLLILGNNGAGKSTFNIALEMGL